jgi:6-pyruvoyltetrahydropterin/6-carboxytetrahydropterin synthase
MRIKTADNLVSSPHRLNRLSTAANPMHYSASRCSAFYKKRGVSLAQLNTGAPARIEPTFASPSRSSVSNFRTNPVKCANSPQTASAARAGANRTQKPHPCFAASEIHNRTPAMAFEISTTREFAAAHALRLYDGSLEPVHGHNWQIRVTVAAPRLDSIGVVMDFHELERLLDAVIRPLHNRHLNDVPPFIAELNPSAENVAYHIGRTLEPTLPTGVKLTRVVVWETRTNRATYIP